ncbi:hypothetical protein BH18THE2_BH18THE2_07690 [soil metagenome]
MSIDKGTKKRIRLTTTTITGLVLVFVMIITPFISSQISNQLARAQSETSNTTSTNQNMSSSSSTMSADTMNTTSMQGPGSILKLSHANVAIDIPLTKGYVNGSEVFYITTDVSDNKTAAHLTNLTGFEVNYAPVLARSPNASIANIFEFKNGINGTGPQGFQPNVADSQPGDGNYSPLWRINLVEWKQGITPRELKSHSDIVSAQRSGELTITPTNIIVNCPFIQWEGGSMKIRENKTISDETAYGGGQVLNIDTQKMVVTMVAHRGWAPDGKTVYYIVVDATPDMPANMMGVTSVKKDEALAGTAAAPPLFQFMNGIKGTGPMGFQSGIGGAGPTDANYSPMWLISFIEWKDQSQAKVLETLADIAAMQRAGMITIAPAMDGKHVVNCPFFDQDTVFKHKSQMRIS